MIQIKGKQFLAVTAAVGAVAFCSSVAPQAQQQPASGSNRPSKAQYHIVRQKIGTFQVIHEMTGQGEGPVWVVTPKPPTLGSQEVETATLCVDGKAAEEVQENNQIPIRRPILKVDTTVHGNVRCQLVVTGTWYSTKVVSGPGTDPQPTLSDQERKMYLRVSKHIDYEDPQFQSWLFSHIQRQPDESDYALTKRTASFFGKYFSYELDGSLRSLSEAALRHPSGNCVTLSIYLVGCYRALGLPAMIYSGMLFGGGNHTQVLVWTEVGWTPVEPTLLCKSHGTDPNGFGFDAGDMLIMGTDADYILPVFGATGIRAPNASRILMSGTSGMLKDLGTNDPPVVKRLSN